MSLMLMKIARFRNAGTVNSFSKWLNLPCRRFGGLQQRPRPFGLGMAMRQSEYQRIRAFRTHAYQLNSDLSEAIIEDVKENDNLVNETRGEEEYDDSYYKNLVDSRYTVLGKTVLQSCLIKHLMDTYSNLDASKIADLASYLSKEIIPMHEKYRMSDDNTIYERRARMYTDIGKIFATHGQSVTYDHIKSLHPYKISENDIDVFCKLAHPRSTLKAILQEKGIPFEVKRTGRKSVSVLIENEIVAEETASTVEKAQYKACLDLLLKNYADDIKNISLNPTEKIFQSTFKDKLTGQRVVNIIRNNEGNFGLFLKGGEKVTTETEKFWRYNYISPIYISKIAEGSPAAESGVLQEGDVILAVGDFILKGMTLESAMQLINREDEVCLTVAYDSKIKIREKINEDFRMRERKAFKDTLRADEWKKWHEAKAIHQPDKYLQTK